MRRIAILFSLVVTASMVPGKRIRAETMAPVVHASIAAAHVNGLVGEFQVAAARPRAEKRVLQTYRHSTGRSLGMAISWLAIVALVGFVLMAFGADKLDIVIRTMQDGVGKSLGSGLLGQLAIVPAAIGVVVLLAATLIGILLIPLGLVAFMFLVAGVAMFGFIAALTMTGAAITRNSRDETPNGAMLRSFVAGTAVYLGLWLVAAALSGVPLLGVALQSFASAVTFIAVTAGFGAVMRSWWQGKFKRAQLAA
ncbi:MAG TPA: hypothetical protein VHM24_06180 [Gemmatimonadaceae bacterium]|nr:hypothetical protein [Gemmatimonadaceae bacterium]